LAQDLTIRQFAQIVLGKTESPLHLGDVLAAYDSKLLMLKSTMRNLSEAQAFMFVTMLSRQDTTNLFGNNPSDVQEGISQMRTSIAAKSATYWSLWADAWLPASLASDVANYVPSYGILASILKSAEASIFYLSPQVPLPSAFSDLGPGTMPPWTAIGITGTFGGLANLNGQILPFWPNNWTTQDWDTITKFASGGNDLLLAPAQLIPSIWLAAQGQVNNLPDANMILLPGS
jgi:hypothetical protein